MVKLWQLPEDRLASQREYHELALRELQAVRSSPSWWRTWRVATRLLNAGIGLVLVGIVGGILGGLLGGLGQFAVYVLVAGVVLAIAGGGISTVAQHRALLDAAARRPPPTAEARA